MTEISEQNKTKRKENIQINDMYIKLEQKNDKYV
jgi:hypothetical protein